MRRSQVSLRRFALLALALGASLPLSAQTNWVNVANSEDSQWDIRAGSLDETTTKGGTRIAVAVGRVSNTKTKRIDVEKWYVSLDDCERQMGKLVTLDVDGEYLYENDFVVGSGSIGGSVAGFICAAHNLRVEARDKKGI